MARKFALLAVALALLGVASDGLAQRPAQVRWSRVVDLTIPIESDMPGIPGIPAYAQNPSRVEIIAIMTEAQKELVRAEGMTPRAT